MSQQLDQKQIIRSKRDLMRTSLKCSLNTKIQVVEQMTEEGLKNSISIPFKSQRKRQYSFDSTSIDTLTPLLSTIIYENFDDLYEIHEKLGQGTESIVYRCSEKKTLKQYAVKVMKIADTQKIESFKYQYNILRNLRHKNIISLRSLFINEVNNKCYILSQYLSYKNLRQVIDDSKKHLKIIQTKNLLYELVDAVNHMHQKNICHRDLKPENIMYNPITEQIKIIDFQIAKIKKDCDDDHFMWTNTGTLYYKAPQMFKGGYSQQIDMWAIGIIAYELLVGKLPFKSNYLKDFIKMINEDQPYFPENILSKKQINFIKQCLKKDPKQRITAQNALFHKLFEKCEQICVSPFKKAATPYFDEQKKLTSQVSVFQQLQKQFCSTFEYDFQF